MSWVDEKGLVRWLKRDEGKRKGDRDSTCASSACRASMPRARGEPPEAPKASTSLSCLLEPLLLSPTRRHPRGRAWIRPARWAAHNEATKSSLLFIVHGGTAAWWWKGGTGACGGQGAWAQPRASSRWERHGRHPCPNPSTPDASPNTYAHPSFSPAPLGPMVPCPLGILLTHCKRQGKARLLCVHPPNPTLIRPHPKKNTQTETPHHP